ncbi:chemokine (C-X-C motif) ligand 18b [Brachyhypopomus gauderio]|uniref:chemokine (C-X-C motif) ligand 18b n=1 Tax=Brachyhypopomus gauderio TaxID=698409 RepID=UPI00404129A3
MGFAPLALLSLVVVTWVHPRNAQTVADRCLCPNTSTKFYPWTNITEFSVTQPKSHCSTIEIILTLKASETGEHSQVCLNTKTNKAKLLRQCWNRNNKDGSKHTLKLSECKFSKSIERK